MSVAGCSWSPLLRQQSCRREESTREHFSTWSLIRTNNLRIMGQSSQSPEWNIAANRLAAELRSRGSKVRQWGEQLPQEMRNLAAGSAKLEVQTPPTLHPCPTQPVQVIARFPRKRPQPSLAQKQESIEHDANNFRASRSQAQWPASAGGCQVGGAVDRPGHFRTYEIH
jgi:hypothetical protein